MANRPVVEVLRLVLLWSALIVLAAFARPTPAILITGAAFMVAGAIVRVWAAGHLFKTKELITSGPYRFTRNPLYLGRLFILTGVAISAWISPVVNASVLAVGWMFFFGYYMPRKERIEPERLTRVHGEPYTAYRHAVPALFPTLHPWPDNGERWKLERFLRNREHMFLAGLAILVAVLALRMLGVGFM